MLIFFCDIDFCDLDLDFDLLLLGSLASSMLRMFLKDGFEGSFTSIIDYFLCISYYYSLYGDEEWGMMGWGAG